MKHVIIINTSDYPDGLPLSAKDQQVLLRVVDLWLETEGRLGYVQSAFNVSSATAAVHEMYNLPKWDPNAPIEQPKRTPDWNFGYSGDE